MMELGGNIKLEGFETLEPAKLIVVKKVVGNYAKTISEKIAFSEFLVTLNEQKVTVKVTAKDKVIEKNDSSDNLFIALDKALAKVKKSV